MKKLINWIFGKSTRSRFLLFVSVGLLVVLLLVKCRNDRLYDRNGNLQKNYQELLDDKGKFEMQVDALGDSVAIQKQQRTTERAAYALGLAKKDSMFSKLQYQIQYSGRIEYRDRLIPFAADTLYDTIRVAYENAVVVFPDSTPVPLMEFLADYIRVPQKLSYHESTVAFNAEVIKEGLKLDSLRLKNNLTFTLGYRKRPRKRFGSRLVNYFRGKEPVLQVKDEDQNPNFRIVGLENVVIVSKNKPFVVSVGGTAGYNMPGGLGISVGLHVGVKLFEF